VAEDVPIVVENSLRVIDFFVRAKDGVSNLLIEAKYSLPRGAALERLSGQLRNALASGRANQVVVWTLRSPGIQQVQNAYTALGDIATKVQFVDGVEGLWKFLSFYYGVQ
jgi:hypothetical protein